jgi:hypothetical protein
MKLKKMQPIYRANGSRHSTNPAGFPLEPYSRILISGGSWGNVAGRAQGPRTTNADRGASTIVGFRPMRLVREMK